MTFVVDDEKFDRYVVTRRLGHRDEFAQITEATTGEEFLDLFGQEDIMANKKSKPILVLMDINMPGINGFETARRLQKRVEAGEVPDSVVVMMCTSSDNPEDRKRAEAIPIIKGYIVKPLDLADVAYLEQLYTQ